MLSGESLAAIQRRTMIVLVITQIFGTVAVGVAPSIGVLLAGDVTQNEAWAGLARTASTLGAALLGLPLGNLAARKGRRVALSFGWLLAAAGSAILVAAAQWSLIVPLFIGLLLIGAGSATGLQARFAATDLAHPKARARSLALIVWVGTIGSVLGPNLGAPGRIVSEGTGLTVFASAFLIAAISLTIAGILVFALLRPDPLLVQVSQSSDDGARVTAVVPPASPQALASDDSRPRPAKKPGSIRAMIGGVRGNAQARLGVLAVLTAQIVMVSIMTMTPVHIVHHGGSVNLVGITISLHIVGMYALAPLPGWISDRLGHRVSIWIGIALFLISLGVGIAWAEDTTWVIVSLIFLGLGWSFVNVAGSAMFSSTLAPEVRASSQGGLDALSNLSGATTAFIAGPLMAATSFGALCIIAIILLVPLAVSLLRGR